MNERTVGYTSSGCLTQKAVSLSQPLNLSTWPISSVQLDLYLISSMILFYPSVSTILIRWFWSFVSMCIARTLESNHVL